MIQIYKCDQVLALHSACTVVVLLLTLQWKMEVSIGSARFYNSLPCACIALSLHWSCSTIGPQLAPLACLHVSLDILFLGYL